jgi:hypothetical protein
MVNDQRTKLIEHLVREIDSGMKMLEPFFRALKAAREQSEAEPPWTSRFCNLPTINAVLRYLNEEARDGATGPEIYEALFLGGCGYNAPNFERDLKNSLIRATKSGVLIKQGEKYHPGKKRPANLMNRHGRKPLK